MLINSRDEVVESRTWSSGVEIVARVNWSQIARVRCALGLAGDELARVQLGRTTAAPALTLHTVKKLPTANARAA
jgi:hypothetical protein